MAHVLYEIAVVAVHRGCWLGAVGAVLLFVWKGVTGVAWRVQGIGGLLHSIWRSRSSADSRGDVTHAKNCIDGDLIEQLLDLPKEDMETIVSKIPAQQQLPLDELVKLIEELQRLH